MRMLCNVYAVVAFVVLAAVCVGESVINLDAVGSGWVDLVVVNEPVPICADSVCEGGVDDGDGVVVFVDASVEDVVVSFRVSGVGVVVGGGGGVQSERPMQLST